MCVLCIYVVCVLCKTVGGGKLCDVCMGACVSGNGECVYVWYRYMYVICMCVYECVVCMCGMICGLEVCAACVCVLVHLSLCVCI